LVGAFGSSPTQVLQLAHGPARDVVQAGAGAEEARQEVEVDLVDQAALEGRRADRGREDLGVLAVGSVEADPDPHGSLSKWLRTSASVLRSLGAFLTSSQMDTRCSILDPAAGASVRKAYPGSATGETV
jgi:hypothetical protein